MTRKPQTIAFVTATVILLACSATTDQDTESSSSLLAVIGGGVFEVGPDGIEQLPGLLPESIRITDVRASRDHSRVVAFGRRPSNPNSGWDVYTRQGNDWQLMDGPASSVRTSDHVQWVWLETDRFGTEGVARLFRYDGTLVAADADPAVDLGLPEYGPNDAYVALRDGSDVRVFFLDGGETRFDPGLGTELQIHAVREDGILVGPLSGGVAWYALDGSVMGDEAEFNRSGFTQRDGQLVWRENGVDEPVATGLPDDPQWRVVTSSSDAVLMVGNTLTWFDTVGREVATFEPEVYDGPLMPPRGIPSMTRIPEVVPMDDRRGVLAVSHSGDYAPGHWGPMFETVHAYRLDENGEVTVNLLDEWVAESPSGRMLARHPDSSFVMWTRPNSDEVIAYDMLTGEMNEYPAEGAVEFALYGVPRATHR